MNRSSKEALETIRTVKRGLEDCELVAEEMEFRHQRLMDFLSTATDTLWEMDENLRLVRGLRVISGPDSRAIELPFEELPFEPHLNARYEDKTTTEALTTDALNPGIEERASLAAHMDDLQAHRPFRGFEFRAILPNGRIGWLESNGIPFFGADGAFLGYRGTMRNITRRKENEEQIAFMARHDVLTGLPNRRHFRERLERALAGTDETHGIAVLCVDVDRFKVINDTLGHPVGDALLKAIAERLSACLNGIDTIARFGADEFAIIQSAVERPEDAASLAQRLAAAIEPAFVIDGKNVSVRVTIGIALAPANADSVEGLVKHADIALTRAKAEESGAWKFFESEMGARIEARRATRTRSSRRVGATTNLRFITSRSTVCLPARSLPSKRCCAGVTRSGD